MLGVAASRPLPPPATFNRLRRRGALAYMGAPRPTTTMAPYPAMTRAAFRATFGVGPAEVGRIDFKGRGLTLEMARLAAVAAVSLIYEGGAGTPPPTTSGTDPETADESTVERRGDEARTPVLPTDAATDGRVTDPRTDRRANRTTPEVRTEGVVNEAAGDAEPGPRRRIVKGDRSTRLTITFGSGRADEPIVIDDATAGQANNGRPIGLPILIDSDDDEECGPSWRGRRCWSVRDGDDVEPGCASTHCREGPATPIEPLVIDSDDDAEPAGAIASRRATEPTSPCYCPVGNDTPGCVCHRLAGMAPHYMPSDADDDDLGCYLPPNYQPTSEIDGGAATGGRSTIPPTELDDPADVEMCGAALECPATPDVCLPAPDYFTGATPRPEPTVTPLPRFGPDPRDSAAAFEIRYGCRPRDFTTAYGVARGLSGGEARYVEMMAVGLELNASSDPKD